MIICETLEAYIIEVWKQDTVVGCENCNWMRRYASDSLYIIRPSWNPIGSAYLEFSSFEICAEDHSESQWEERAIQEEDKNTMIICETLEAYIIDDGTLDTVIGCRACDWIGRYSNNGEISVLIQDEFDHEEAWEICDEDHYQDQLVRAKNAG